LLSWYFFIACGVQLIRKLKHFGYQNWFYFLKWKFCKCFWFCYYESRTILSSSAGYVLFRAFCGESCWDNCDNCFHLFQAIDFKIRKKPSQGKDFLYQMRNPQAILYLQLFKDSENDKKFNKYPNQRKERFDLIRNFLMSFLLSKFFSRCSDFTLKKS
jgi:hypothetical protein